MLRIPGWADGTKILVNGKEAGVEAKPGTFATIKRSWKTGDVVALDMPMEIKLMEGHPRIEEVRNQVAIKRGPVVYCIESPDLPAGTGILDVYLPENANLTAAVSAGFLGRSDDNQRRSRPAQDSGDGMYRAVENPKWKTVTTQFVPYYCWCNRGQSEMTVFMPLIWE